MKRPADFTIQLVLYTTHDDWTSLRNLVVSRRDIEIWCSKSGTLNTIPLDHVKDIILPEQTYNVGADDSKTPPEQKEPGAVGRRPSAARRASTKE